jgi:transposase
LPTAESYNVNKKNISVTSTWVQGEHPNTYTISRKQRAPLSIDEVNLSIGELYSVVTNKEAKGVTIMAIATGTKAETVINHLHRIESYKRNQVIETLDMANSMQLISRKVFLKAKQVTDRFQVQNQL